MTPPLLRAAALTVVTVLAAAWPAAGAPAASTAVAAADGPAALVLDVTAGDPVDTGAGGNLDAGDTVPFTYTITNTGSQVLAHVTITDALAGSERPECPQIDELPPGAQLVCHLSHRITRQDIAAGTLDDAAYARAETTGGALVISPTDATSTILAAYASVSLGKPQITPSDTNGTGRIDAGDVVTFRFPVTNSGDLTLSDLTIEDPSVTPAGCVSSVLPTDETTTCVGSHVLSPLDVDSGALKGEARAVAVSPAGSVVDSAPVQMTTIIPASPSISLTVLSTLIDGDGDGLADPGESVGYTFVVNNSGTTSLHNVRISDQMLEDAGDAIRCPIDTLLTGQTVTCAAIYEIRSGDVDGPLVTTASVRADSATVVTSPFVSARVTTDSSGDHSGSEGGGPGWWIGGGLLAVIALGGATLVVRRQRRAVVAPDRDAG